MNIGENICRICFNIVEFEFNVIDDVARRIFDILLLKMKLDTTGNPIICWNCMETAKKSFYFKSLCITTEKRILCFSLAKRQVVFKLKDTICRFCMNQLDVHNFVLIDFLKKEPVFLEMLSVFMPEMDFNTIQNPMICTSCRKSLECYFMFVLNSSHIEVKINTYCDELGTVDQVQLSDIKKFFHTHTLEHFNKKPAGVVYYEFIKSEEAIDIKDEINIYENINKSHDTMRDYSEIAQMPLYKISSETMVYKCEMCPFQTWRASSFTRHKGNHSNSPTTSKKATARKKYKCPECSSEFKFKNYLKAHMTTHKDPFELNMHKCVVCSFKTKYKWSLTGHMRVHREGNPEVEKCPLCDYKTRHKTCLKTHMLIHKDASDLNIFKCAMCSYQTKRKTDIKNHMAVHLMEKSDGKELYLRSPNLREMWMIPDTRRDCFPR